MKPLYQPPNHLTTQPPGLPTTQPPRHLTAQPPSQPRSLGAIGPAHRPQATRSVLARLVFGDWAQAVPTPNLPWGRTRPLGPRLLTLLHPNPPKSGKVATRTPSVRPDRFEGQKGLWEGQASRQSLRATHRLRSACPDRGRGQRQGYRYQGWALGCGGACGGTHACCCTGPGFAWTGGRARGKGCTHAWARVTASI